MKNLKGFQGLIFLIIIAAFILFWFVYLWNNKWYKGDLRIPRDALQGAPENYPSAQSKAIDEQLNDLRQDVKSLQNKRDQEILNELK